MGLFEMQDLAGHCISWTMRKRKEITRVELLPDEIMDRILKTMQHEESDILSEGISNRAEDIDDVMINGYGCPRWRGGPMFRIHRGEKSNRDLPRRANSNNRFGVLSCLAAKTLLHLRKNAAWALTAPAQVRFAPHVRHLPRAQRSSAFIDYRIGRLSKHDP